MMAQDAQFVNGTNPDVQVFEYPVVAAGRVPSWEAFSSVALHHAAGEHAQRTADEAHEVKAAVGETHPEELRRSFEAGLARGLEEGRAAERQCLAALAKTQEAGRIEETARLAESFNAQRSRYFENVEREAVKLALGLAGRILRRESEMDPLLLSGAVRVALGQLSASTEVRLQVPAADFELWRDTIAHLPNLNVKPAVVADEGMRLGECRLETELGSVDLSLGSQLAEIERAFFDGSGAEGENPESSMRAIKVAEDMGE